MASTLRIGWFSDNCEIPIPDNAMTGLFRPEVCQRLVEGRGCPYLSRDPKRRPCDGSRKGSYQYPSRDGFPTYMDRGPDRDGLRASGFGQTPDREARGWDPPRESEDSARQGDAASTASRPAAGVAGPMKVERRGHPRGETGTRASLDEVAKRAAEGRLDPRTRAWAIEKIVQAGNPKPVVDRAAAILNALRRERIYIEDPTDAEFIPSAACTLHGCQGLKFLGEDCDGLLTSFLAAIGSIGIWGAVIGHSYEPTGQISHVLAGVFDGQKWHRCDPSTKQPFGVVSKPTRERWVAVHDGRVLCDRSNGKCMDSQIEHPLDEMRPVGEFVGVGRPRFVKENTGMLGTPDAATNVMLPSNPIERAPIAQTLSREVENLDQAITEMRLAHANLVALREELDKPLTDVDVTQSGQMSAPDLEEVSGEGLWSQEDEARYQKTLAASNQLLVYGQEALSGHRQVGRRDDNGEIVILGKPDEPRVVMSDDMQQAALLNFPWQPQGAVALDSRPSGQVGWYPILVGAVVIVVGIAAIVGYHDYTQLEQRKLDSAATRDASIFYQQRRQVGDSHEDALSALNALSAAAAKRAASQVEAAKQSGLGQIGETLQTIMWAAFGLGAVYVGGYTLVSLLQHRRSQQITGIPILAR